MLVQPACLVRRTTPILCGGPVRGDPVPMGHQPDGPAIHFGLQVVRQMSGSHVKRGEEHDLPSYGTLGGTGERASANPGRRRRKGTKPGWQRQPRLSGKRRTNNMTARENTK